MEKDEVGTSIQRLQGDSVAVSEVDCGWYGDHGYNKETITALLLKVEWLEGNQIRLLTFGTNFLALETPYP